MAKEDLLPPEAADLSEEDRTSSLGIVEVNFNIMSADIEVSAQVQRDSKNALADQVRKH